MTFNILKRSVSKPPGVMPRGRFTREQNSADEAAFRSIADRICTIKDNLMALADQLGEHGGALRFISDTFGQLYNEVLRCITRLETP